MQSIGWYGHRLLSMSPGEIAWRVSNLLRDRFDRALLPARHERLAAQIRAISRMSDAVDLQGLLIRGDADLVADRCSPDAIVSEAREIMSHRIRLFGDDYTDVGTPIRWNYEHNKGAPTPTGFAGDIDYRDYELTGDCKWVWELNRHHHLVVLGRAHRITGDRSYADEIIAQIGAWIDACPFGTGMNWRSPLELSIRLINWVVALELIADSGAIDAAARRRIDHSVFQHLWDVTRKYSRYSSANNHLVGEAGAVHVAATAFGHLPGAARWRDAARTILIRQMAQQVDPDGVHRELATGYHLFVLQFFLLAHLAGSRRGDAFPHDYAKRLEAMFEFLAALDEGGSPAVKFGDCDDGYVVDLGGARGDFAPWLNVGARLFGRPDFERPGVADREAAALLLGDDMVRPPADPRRPAQAATSSRGSASRRFEEAGIYLLQSNTPDDISVTIDCGPLGFNSIAAHGHADALSVTLRAFGAPFLIDPGTYDYFSYPEWRDYFRSTRAHNTVEIDGCDQSEMLGKFLWGRRAEARCLEWNTEGHITRFVGQHDGYTRLTDPVIHRRAVELDGRRRILRIRDEVNASHAHGAVLHFHFAPDCVVEKCGPRTVRATRNEGWIEFTLPHFVKIDLVRGATDPILGWCSDAYHQRRPITTLRVVHDITGEIVFDTTVQISATDSDS